jgi:acyl-CoA synthetase (AMP-forming)/AMP-acid ligase II
VEHIDRIPVTGTGKFDKKLLRARLARPQLDGSAGDDRPEAERVAQ